MAFLNVGDPNWDDPPSMVPFPAEKQQVMGGFHGKSEVGNDCLLAGKTSRFVRITRWAKKNQLQMGWNNPLKVGLFDPREIELFFGFLSGSHVMITGFVGINTLKIQKTKKSMVFETLI